MHHKNANKNVKITDKVVTDYVQYSALVNEWTQITRLRKHHTVCWLKRWIHS